MFTLNFSTQEAKSSDELSACTCSKQVNDKDFHFGNGAKLGSAKLVSALVSGVFDKIGLDILFKLSP